MSTTKGTRLSFLENQMNISRFSMIQLPEWSSFLGRLTHGRYVLR